VNKVSHLWLFVLIQEDVLQLQVSVDDRVLEREERKDTIESSVAQ